MTDPCMDPYEAIAYGRFTAAQINTLLLGLDLELDGTLRLMASRVATASESLEAALLRAGVPELFLHRAAEGAPDAVQAARETLRSLVHDAEACRDGFMLTSRLLQGESLSTAVRRTPTKLITRLAHAREAIEKMKDVLPEHASWSARVEQARAALAAFDDEVHAGRSERRSMTADVATAWNTWQRAYASAKHVVLGVLAGVDKVPLIREVFDDLADESPSRLSQLPQVPATY
ncbi:hypothetical protein [Polyangium fumosum]|uniref:Uncharacterized protein n=1 Tax=Polyangium fumosum TaxID=889272 RepID=A0A4U1IHL6_9BACT|nr:hypothetical protein [Polyangium fumosum]TKC93333.1 hypothetical protein E8A74_49750 [Polyangium fumosum]